MCMDGISPLVMNDDEIQQILSNASLDLIHMQVLIALYSLASTNSLHEYKQMLPVYLSTDWARCEPILDALEEVGLIARRDEEIELIRKITNDNPVDACGCHSH